jgi:hypothetical protein
MNVRRLMSNMGASDPLRRLHLRRWHITVRQETAALRDFDPAYVNNGSETSQTALAAGREEYHRAQGQVCAIRGHRCSKRHLTSYMLIWHFTCHHERQF